MRDTIQRPSVTWRAMLLGAALVGAISVISPWAVLMVKGSQLTSNAIPVIAVVFLFVLTLIGVPLLRAAGSRWQLGRGELVTVYAMMLVGSVVVTTGLTGSFLSIITGAQYYASPENEWAELFLPHIHPWLGPSDTEAIRLFYEGMPPGMPLPWHAWRTSLVAWTSFILVFYWVILSIGVLLRGQWVDHERLVFPLTRLPLAMVEDAQQERGFFARLYRQRLLWVGLAVPLLLQSWNSLHFYHEAFRPVRLSGSVVLLPGLVGMPFRLNFPVLGLAYLMATNVAFSIWFFFLLGLLQWLLFARLGVSVSGGGDIWTSGGYSLPCSYQMAGGMLALALSVLWTARPHLRRLGRLAWRGQAAPGEILSPRLAFGSVLGGSVFLLAWLWFTGMSFYVAVLLVVGALLAFIGLSRVVCEAGLPGAQVPMVPQAFITRGLGPEVLGLRNMTCLGFSTVWMGETAANMMNAVVHSLKLSSWEGRPSRRMPWAILLAIAVGLAGSIWFTMRLAYRYGGINLNSWYYDGAARWPFDYMSSVFNVPEASVGLRFAFALGGAVFMGVLLFLRQRFVWWPLHPIGFPIAMTYTIVSYGWFSIFLAWLAKSTILRYGGVRLYRTLLPLFLGFVLGEFVAASAWVFIDGAHGVEGNMIFNF